MYLCNYCFTVIQKFVVSVFHPLGGIGVETLIGGCRERVTSCSGFLGADATERGGQGGGSPPLRGSIGQAALGGFLGQSPESLGRAHNYESEARSYSGLYQGQALHLPARSLRIMVLTVYG